MSSDAGDQPVPEALPLGITIAGVLVVATCDKPPSSEPTIKLDDWPEVRKSGGG